MASENFKLLMKLLFTDKKKINKVGIKLSKDDFEYTKIDFTDEEKFESQEADVAKYAFSLKSTINSDGDYEIASYNNLDKYYSDIEYLLDKDNTKLKKAVEDIRTGRYRFKFDPDKLLEEFLSSKRRKSKKFLPLKTEYFHICAYNLLQSHIALVNLNKAKSKYPEIDGYYKKIDYIFMKAFRNDRNFVKNYIRQQKAGSFDLGDFAKQVISVTDYTKALKDIFPKQGVKPKTGINFVLDMYRRYAEACVKPLNLLRIGQEIMDGVASPEPKKTSEQNKTILLKSLGPVLDCFDGRIRNSESHLSTEIDNKGKKILITKSQKEGREVLTKYTFEEMIGMTNTIKDKLLPSLTFTLYIEWRVMLLVIVYPLPEYKILLLQIDNT